MTDVTRGEIYREQYAHFRSMNEILYKMPPLFTAVIGGLWFFAAENLQREPAISLLVFVFSALASVAFVNIVERFRLAFNGYIQNLNRMDGDWKVSIQGSCLPSTIRTIQCLLWFAALCSAFGAAYTFFV